MFIGVPRTADHAQRRRQVIDAAIKVLASGEGGGPTMADVAAEAGVSVGLVQRYFATKDEMLLLTFEHLGARLVERVERSWDAGGSIRARLRGCLLELLPLDAERSTEIRVYQIFCGRATGSPALREVQVALHAATRGDLAASITAAQAAGEIHADRDAAMEAIALWAFVDGLALHASADPDGLPPAAVVRAVDSQLDKLFFNDWTNR